MDVGAGGFLLLAKLPPLQGSTSGFCDPESGCQHPAADPTGWGVRVTPLVGETAAGRVPDGPEAGQASHSLHACAGLLRFTSEGTS